MPSGAIDLDQKFEKFSKPWSPRIIAQLNDLHVKAAKVQGAFVKGVEDQPADDQPAARRDAGLPWRAGGLSQVASAIPSSCLARAS